MEIRIERIKYINDSVLRVLESFKEVSWDKDNLNNFVSSKNNLLLIARDGDNGCGLIRAHLLYRYDNKGPEMLLHEIDVLPDYQKQGIATALIEKLKEIAKEIKASEIWVLTNKSNQAAMALYNKTGGKVTHDDDVVFIYEL